MDDDQQFCLRWNNHQSTLISVFDTLLENETLVDCTLAAEGKFLKAHKVVLSACSPYFATLLQEQYDKHPIFILKDVKYQELRAMMDYMYRGEVNISQDQLAALLKAAESLQIKGLSDNRTGGGSAPKPESTQQHHRGKLSSAYTLEQTKRARMATGAAMDASGDVSGSREGSSSPSRRRRKVRRRSMENDAHDNSNSSVLQAAASNQSILQQTGAGLAVSALVSTQLAGGPAAGSSSQASSTQQQPLTSTNVTKKTESAKLTSSTAAPASGAAASAASGQQGQQQNPSDAINTENVQAQSQCGAQGVQGDDEDMDAASGAGGVGAAGGVVPASAAAAVHTGVVVKQLASVVDKSSNHKQKIKDNSVSSVGSEMVIEPKAEYDDDAHDENVEDLTLDDEDMTMEELDQTAGTSQGGEGSSQSEFPSPVATLSIETNFGIIPPSTFVAYATWQHDRSQDELGLMAQDAQQRDPQASKQDKGEQTEGTPDEFELDDCLLESNDIVITQNKDGFVLHVKKLGNITAAKLGTEEDQSVVGAQTTAAVTVTGPAGQPTPTITELLSAAAASHTDKPTLTTLTSTPIKLPSSECELINIKKIIPATTTIATHHPHTSSTIIHPHHIIQHVPQETHHQEHHQQQQTQHQTIHIEEVEVPQTSHHHQQQQQHHQLQAAQPTHTQVQSIITTHPGQTINLVGLRNVQLTDQKPMASRIRYSRGKIIGPTVQNLQIVETHEPIQHQHHELADGTKYEISEIDLNNASNSAAIISDFVKYAEIDDIELPDGTKIGIGFAPSEITEHMQATGGETHITTIEQEPQELQVVPQSQTHTIHATQLQTHHIQTVVQTADDQQQQQHHHQRIQLQDDDGVETILPEELGVHDSSKSYTILTTRPMKEESDAGNDPSGMTYELSLSDSSLGPCDDPESRYVCRHCGKKYRWKSTLRRHENVECGGKEPCHPCPYCTYKAKQRGNLGVHVRKHHPEKPQLESKRGRKI
ncbi:hypothetical protein KR018_003633 [Drosophila ironensis]|nr:hypothetical protein KR018_003633 [Drosophila ironensis]